MKATKSVSRASFTLILFVVFAVGCQNLPFSGEYDYDEFSSSGTENFNLDSGVLVFQEATKFTLTPESASLSDPEEGYFLAKDDGLFNFLGNKGNFGAIYTPDGSTIVTPAMLAQPGEMGVGWALKSEERLRDVSGGWVTMFMSHFNSAEGQGIVYQRGHAGFDAEAETCNFELCLDFGDCYSVEGNFSLADDGAVSFGDEMATFVGRLDTNDSFIIASTSISDESSTETHYSFSAKVTGDPHELAGTYNLIRFSKQYDTVAELDNGTLKFYPGDIFTIEFDDEFHFGPVSRSEDNSTLIFEFYDSGLYQLQGLMPTENNALMVLSNSIPGSYAEYIVAAKVPEQG